MAEYTRCNNCKKKVKYIVSRKGGTMKCDPSPIQAIQESGRIVEVYLLHECDNLRTYNETPKKEAQEGKLWVGPDNNPGRESDRGE